MSYKNYNLWVKKRKQKKIAQIVCTGTLGGGRGNLGSAKNRMLPSEQSSFASIVIFSGHIAKIHSSVLSLSRLPNQT